MCAVKAGVDRNGWDQRAARVLSVWYGNKTPGTVYAVKAEVDG